MDGFLLTPRNMYTDWVLTEIGERCPSSTSSAGVLIIASEQREVDQCWFECHYQYPDNAELLDDALEAWFRITAAKREAPIYLIPTCHVSHSRFILAYPALPVRQPAYLPWLPEPLISTD